MVAAAARYGERDVRPFLIEKPARIAARGSGATAKHAVVRSIVSLRWLR